MAEIIKLEQIVIDGMEIKMGRHGCHVIHLIRRVLDRGKCVYLLTVRKDDDTSGMLSRSPQHSRAAEGYPVDLSRSCMDLMSLIELFCIAVCSLVGKSLYRAGAEGMSRSEYDLCILMGF